MKYVSVLMLMLICSCEEPECISLQNVTVFGIIGGEQTNYQSFQGVVGLYGTVTQTVCTGTLIAPNIVLTAAHCVYAPEAKVDYISEPNKLIIVGGSDLCNSNELIVHSSVNEIIVHPSWKEEQKVSKTVDLALLKLKEELDLDHFTIRENAPIVGEQGLVVGYGKNGIDNDRDHKFGLTELITVNDVVIETGNTDAAPCYGDSGGPLFTEYNGKWYLTGVISYGSTTECTIESGNWSVALSAYIEWINEEFQDLTGFDLDTKQISTQEETTECL